MPTVRELLKQALKKCILRAYPSFGSNRLISTKIGNHVIRIPARNPLSRHYQWRPLTQSCLRCLVQAMRAHFDDFSAVDIGANVGDTLAIIKSGADIPVICVEGDSACIGILKRNIGQFSRVSLIEAYLGEESGEELVHVRNETWNATLTPGRGTGARKIHFETIDRVLPTVPGWEKTKIIKVDCEGFDLRILRGGGKVIAELSPVLVFEYNQYNLPNAGDVGLEFFPWLTAQGYDDCFIFDADGSFILQCSASDRRLLRDLDRYISAAGNPLSYLDIVAFPGSLKPVAGTYRDICAELSLSSPRAWNSAL